MGFPSITQFIPQAEPVVTEIGAVKKSVIIGASQVLQKGTLVAQQTANKNFYPYVHAHSDGTQLAVGVLAQNVDTTNNGGNPQEADVYFRGTFWYNNLIGTDSNFLDLLSSFQQQQISVTNILSL